MKAVLVLSALLLVSGCALDPNNHTLIVLQNPVTKEMKDCTAGDPWATWNGYAHAESCAKAYEKAGFVRMGSY